MSEAPMGGIPPETLGDRLARALRHAKVSNGEMADYLGVHRNTVSAYLNDRAPVKAGALRLWAMRCGVDMTWLESGVERTTPPPTRPTGTKPDSLRKLTENKRSRTRATRPTRSNAGYPVAA